MEDFIEGFGITQNKLATAIGVPPRRINEIVLGKRGITADTAIRLGELALEAGLPEGLFQVIVGSGSVVGQRFVSHPDVRKVVFTGSTEVGTEVAAGID